MSLHEPQSAHAPDLIHPVIGFRQWRLTGDGLLSIACDDLWRGPTLDARCYLRGHPEAAAPVSSCSCGIYAWYGPSPRTASAGTRDYIAGAVVLWGAIELHVTGMRAQHCRIVALALPLSRWAKRHRAKDVAGRLGVPVVRHRELGTIARQHGAPVPAGLRPPPDWFPAARPQIGVVPRMVDRRLLD